MENLRIEAKDPSFVLKNLDSDILHKIDSMGLNSESKVQIAQSMIKAGQIVLQEAGQMTTTVTPNRLCEDEFIKQLSDLEE